MNDVIKLSPKMKAILEHKKQEYIQDQLWEMTQKMIDRVLREKRKALEAEVYEYVVSEFRKQIPKIVQDTAKHLRLEVNDY